MDKYDVAEMKYWNEYKAAKERCCRDLSLSKYCFEEEKTLNMQEKIETIDNDRNGFATLVLKLADDFVKDYESGVIKSIKRYGEVIPNGSSMQAWLKRKQKEYQMFEKISDWHDGSQIHIGDGDYCNLKYLKTEEERAAFVDKVFHKVLQNRVLKERKWFTEHDEYSVLNEKVRHHPLLDAVEFPYVISSRDGFLIGAIKSRKATAEELKAILAKLDELQEYAKKIGSEITKMLKNK